MVWLTVQQALPTNNLRVSVCNHPIEYLIHCLHDCPQAHKIWDSLGFNFVQDFFTLTLEEWISTFARGDRAIFQTAAWWIRRFRSNQVVGNKD